MNDEDPDLGRVSWALSMLLCFFLLFLLMGCTTPCGKDLSKPVSECLSNNPPFVRQCRIPMENGRGKVVGCSDQWLKDRGWGWVR